MGRKDTGSEMIHAGKGYGVQAKVFINIPREIAKAGHIRTLYY